jgi:hypothetical protein
MKALLAALPMSLAGLALAGLALAGLALAGPALALECWEDVTPAACPTGTTQRLLFKNSCPGNQTIRVCLKWTSGAQKGAVRRYAATAAKDKLGEISLAPCNSGQFNYTYNYDGSEPDCPE